MGEGTADVNEVETPAQIEREVEGIREEMTGIVRELGRRKRELFDWRLQLKKHALLVGLATAGVVLVAGASLGMVVWSQRRRRKPISKARAIGRALVRVVKHPEYVARPPRPAEKALNAAASSAAATLGKAIMQSLVATVRSVPSAGES